MNFPFYNRAFIAVCLDAKIKQQIQELIRSLNYPSMRWVPNDNLHMTLNFLGKLSTDSIPALVERLNQIASVQKSFIVESSSVVIRPVGHKHTVIALEIKSSSELISLVSQIQEKETPSFWGHITLGRMSHRLMLVDSLPTTGYKIKVEEFALLYSSQTPEGNIYTPLARFTMRDL